MVRFRSISEFGNQRAVQGEKSGITRFFGRRNIAAILFAAVSLLTLGAMLSGCRQGGAEELLQDKAPDIVISEVMSSNDIVLPAADGRCYDWIELHNLTDKAYDLSKCYITDDERNPKKFQLNGLEIEPNGYAVVYLSGLNGVDTNGYLHAGFKLSSMGETVYLNDSTGVVMVSVQMPESPSNVSYGFPASTTEYAQAGGVWFASPTPGEENGVDYAADPSQLTFSVNSVVISEYITGNTFFMYDSDGEYCDWVELHNPSEEDAPMRGYSLTDSTDVSKGKWYFPNDTVIPAGGYLLVFCSGKSAASDPSEIHCSFSLGGDDSAITLISPSGIVVDSVPIYSLPDNVSCGVDPESGEKKLYASPTPGAANSTHSYALDETAIHGVPSSGVVISEVSSVSSGREKNIRDYDYVELYNRSSKPIDLEGYGLSDKEDEVRFTFPSTTLAAGEFLVIDCTNSTEAKSANQIAAFGIARSGEKLYLTYPDGRIADVFSAGNQDVSLSRGRLMSDLSQWCYFSEPTPGKENADDSAYPTYARQPVFSSDGGFVEEGYVLTMQSGEGEQIRYTTDGSLPNAFSQLYDSGISIAKTTVIRAAAFKDGLLPSETTTATFFVNAEHTLPVVSVSSDPDGLFSDENGIFSSEKGFDGKNPNYRSEVERLASFEYYVEGKRAIAFNAGIRVFGRGTRAAKQKSIAVMLREIYGINEADYPFFEDNPITEFNSLVLRQSGQEWRKSKLRDELCAAIMKNQVKCDYMDMTPAVLYINGEYWGLYYVREKQNEDYIVRRYGYSPDGIDIIRDQSMAVAGTTAAYKKMISFVKNNDMTSDKIYERFCEMVDMESLMDFWICQSFFGNDDTANIRCHYSTTDEGAKWRWMIFDLDNAFYPYTLRKNPFKGGMLDPEGHGFENALSTTLTKRLYQNKTFRKDFVTRFCYHLKNTFNAERTNAILDEIVAAIESEIPRQEARWGEPSPEIWNDNLEDIREYLGYREKCIIVSLKSSFGLSTEEFQKIYDAA